MQQSLLVFLDNLDWMAFNTALAFLPMFLAILLFKPSKRINLLWIIGFLLFILFLPNAPYVATDIIHIHKDIYEISIPLEIFLVVFQYIVFILVGIYLFTESYYRFEVFLKSRFEPNILTVRAIVFTLVGIGIYLGRFLRLNSWDVFVRSFSVVGQLRQLFEPEAVIYTAAFVLMLYAFYWIYLEVKKH